MVATYLIDYGGKENLKHGSLPDPVAGEGKALIEIQAAGVNPVEPGICAGMFKAAFPFMFPQVMGFDISGVVVSAPSGSDFSLGDEIYARLSSWNEGGYAERVATPVSLLALKPKRLSHIEAAEGAASRIQPFIEQAAARGATFHGPLTVPDGAQLAEIGAVIDASAIHATVTATYSLDAVAAAYDALGSGHTRGKIVVTI